MAKSLRFTSHPAEETLERYCLNQLDEDAVALLEEHLLACEECQQQVNDLDAFLKALKVASEDLRESRYRKPDLRWNWLGRPMWAAAGVMAVGALVLVPTLRQARSPETIPLSLSRGAVEETGAGVVHAGRPLNLRLDLTGIPGENCCFVQLVAADGKVLNQTSVTVVDRHATVAYLEGLSKGQYWIRVKNSAGEDLREMGLLAR